MIMTSQSLLCWALWIFADGDNVRPPISTLQCSHNKPAVLELADCPRTPRGLMISPERGRTGQTLLSVEQKHPLQVQSLDPVQRLHMKPSPRIHLINPKIITLFFDSLLHPVSDEILILCELFFCRPFAEHILTPSSSNSAAHSASVLFKLWCFFCRRFRYSK